MNPYPESYRLAVPPLCSLFMVVWALLTPVWQWLSVAEAGAFAWYLYPLFATFAVSVLGHGYLILLSPGIKRLDQAFYALVHLPLAFVIWIFAIMQMSGRGW
ncbi:MAG: hypothetical protein ACRCT7_06050 [Shewanella sp.]|uniref:hypothetical protein n=1 Tax=Shewanella sp. SNU WT4 TaxID=2590015 RepID=UPI00112A12FE|nr:hypothetical protein [Shewanella sp. SNU WT4]QDF68161.1 hypothetical protein FJQ87_17135 [Shewanella sp. SNU WT4]